MSDNESNSTRDRTGSGISQDDLTTPDRRTRRTRPETEVAANAARSFRSGQRRSETTGKIGGSSQIDKSKLRCTHCGMSKHTEETCFRLVGYPEWWEDNHKGKENRGIGSRHKEKESQTGSSATAAVSNWGATGTRGGGYGGKEKERPKFRGRGRRDEEWLEEPI